MNLFSLFKDVMKKMEDQINKRSFIIGDEWAYFKLYSGAKTADRILEEVIKPLVLHLIEKSIIDSWYFIRYSDPDLHLRVRLHCPNPKCIGNIIRIVNYHVNDFVKQELIWKIQTDTYHREIERYSESTIELSEKLFFLDSALIIQMIPLTKSADGELQRWLFGLKSIDCMLDCFRLSMKDKLLLLSAMKEEFGKEFGMNRFLKKQLDKKFSVNRRTIEECLSSSSENESIIKSFLVLLKAHKEKVIPIAEEIIQKNKNPKNTVPLESLIRSYIHMMMNRLFRSKQRIHELVLYDFLFRYYRSSIARLTYNE
jgi:thiopeptide-type bacteriocin biosynthesis protein